jgi:hypothetical protein
VKWGGGGYRKDLESTFLTSIFFPVGLKTTVQSNCKQNKYYENWKKPETYVSEHNVMIFFLPDISSRFLICHENT